MQPKPPTMTKVNITIPGTNRRAVPPDAHTEEDSVSWGITLAKNSSTESDHKEEILKTQNEEYLFYKMTGLYSLKRPCYERQRKLFQILKRVNAYDN